MIIRSHAHLRISIPQMCAPNNVFSLVAGHQTCYCHLFNTDESDSNSDSVVTTYAVAAGNSSDCSLIRYQVGWQYLLFVHRNFSR